MPSRIEFARRAIADLEAIEDHGRREFGAAQAGRYQDALLDDMALLLNYPALGPAFAKRNLRRKACGAHVIFYRVEGHAVRIIRILHQRMDPSRHL